MTILYFTKFFNWMTTGIEIKKAPEKSDALF